MVITPFGNSTAGCAISFSIKITDAMAGSESCILSSGDYLNNSRLCYYPDGSLKWILPGGEVENSTPVNTINLNVWYHVAIITSNYVTDRLAHVYVDGKYSFSSESCSSNYLTGSSFSLGKFGNFYGPTSFTGAIDEVKVYNRTLSVAEIGQLMPPPLVWTLKGNSMSFPGRVGIATNPQYTLDVNGDINFVGNLYKNGQLFSQWNNNGANTYLSAANANLGIGTATPGAKLSFGDLNDGRNTADGITWYSSDPLSYGIYRTNGSWLAPNYQQLKMSWSTGIIIDGGAAYGKSGTVIQPGGGNVLIGKTTQTSTTYKLDVAGTVNATKYIGDGSGLTGLNSQWTTNNSDIYYNTGNVGIGTNTPATTLHIKSNQTSVTVLFLEASKWNATGDYSELRFGDVSHYIRGEYINGMTFYDMNKYQFLGGNVLIGKSSQVNNTYKLDVAGSMRADEVIINTDGADFVFEENYKLTSLKELEAYITVHKHLPNIAPAAEMKINGVGVSEMQTKLLEKIEQLTLYIIEQNKTNQELLKRVEKLEMENKAIKETTLGKSDK
jgi:hypothetical protein